jgi:hypothetical protein
MMVNKLGKTIDFYYALAKIDLIVACKHCTSIERELIEDL